MFASVDKHPDRYSSPRGVGEHLAAGIFAPRLDRLAPAEVRLEAADCAERLVGVARNTRAGIRRIDGVRTRTMNPFPAHVSGFVVGAERGSGHANADTCSGASSPRRTVHRRHHDTSIRFGRSRPPLANGPARCGESRGSPFHLAWMPVVEEGRGGRSAPAAPGRPIGRTAAHPSGCAIPLRRRRFDTGAASPELDLSPRSSPRDPENPGSKMRRVFVREFRDPVRERRFRGTATACAGHAPRAVRSPRPGMRGQSRPIWPRTMAQSPRPSVRGPRASRRPFVAPRWGPPRRARAAQSRDVGNAGVHLSNCSRCPSQSKVGGSDPRRPRPTATSGGRPPIPRDVRFPLRRRRFDTGAASPELDLSPRPSPRDPENPGSKRRKVFVREFRDPVRERRFRGAATACAGHAPRAVRSPRSGVRGQSRPIWPRTMAQSPRPSVRGPRASRRPFVAPRWSPPRRARAAQSRDVGNAGVHLAIFSKCPSQSKVGGSDPRRPRPTAPSGGRPPIPRDVRFPLRRRRFGTGAAAPGLDHSPPVTTRSGYPEIETAESL